MKKFSGTYEANLATVDGVLEDMQLILELESFHDKIILNVDSNMEAVSMYFETPNEFTCVFCKRSHWNDETMKCEKNQKLMNEIWELLKPQIEKQMKDNSLFDIVKH